MSLRVDRWTDDERGFTLVELLSVILIIGILAAIALPNFTGQTDRARAATAKSAVENALSAAETYFADNQTYAGLTKDVIARIDPSLRNAPWSPAWCGDSGGLIGTADVLCVAMRSTGSSQIEFEIRNDASYGPGTTRLCSDPGKPGCKTGGVFGWGTWTP